MLKPYTVLWNGGALLPDRPGGSSLPTPRRTGTRVDTPAQRERRRQQMAARRRQVRMGRAQAQKGQNGE